MSYTSPDHTHYWRSRRLVMMQAAADPYGGGVDRYAHDMRCEECGAQLEQPDREHPTPDTHEWIRSTVKHSCHTADVSWKCDCGAKMRETVTYAADSDLFAKWQDLTNCADCRHLKASGDAAE